MLAVQMAWSLLEAEHRHMRAMLDEAVMLAGQGGGTCHAATARRVLPLLDELEAFDKATHRPKGLTMLGTMKGRSAAADLHLDAMASARARADAALMHAKALLKAAADGDILAQSTCQSLLSGYREVLLQQMDEEETLLRRHAESVLTQEEWSLLVSEMSSRLAAARPPPASKDGGASH
ncbi:hemerythrin domain-containing protein [Caldimonas sp. KR1-144]|uniref:hemerythrin domain-containing protein n=1 Tax=Caldimonas sp. KR1-144 TaxID=3400911 RepID=UPI003C01D695